MVMGIFGLLIHMSVLTYMDYRRKAYNTQALSDGRNLATVVSNSLVDEEDVDYTHGPEDSGAIGFVDTEGNPRQSIYSLSDGVKARILGSSSFTGGLGYMEAYIYHENGSSDPFAPSLKREYMCLVDEFAGVITFSLN